MEAMILAAGAGTRLQPLTLNKPKPLFPVCNRPLLALTLDRLRALGVRRLILNAHHLAGQIRAFVQDFQTAHPSLQVEIRYESDILGTGGGLKNTEDFWTGDPFLVVNGDIVWDLDLSPALDFHRRHGGPVTLILRDVPAFNNILAEPAGRVQQFRVDQGNAAFTGIQILNREILDLLPANGFYDIIPVYQQLIERGLPIQSWQIRDGYWRDMGTPDAYRQVHQEILIGKVTAVPEGDGHPTDVGKHWCIHSQADIHPGARLEGWGAIGAETRIGEGCMLRDSILWNRVRVGKGAVIRDSIVGDDVNLEGVIIGKIMK